MFLPNLATTNKSLPRFTFGPLTFLIVVGTLTLFSACKDGEEEPSPSEPEPVITGFAPTSGIIGTTVVIVGQNFSPNIAENMVKVGNVVATLTAATATSLSITIPTDVVTGKISVTVGGKSVTSANDFVVVAGPSDFFTLTVDASYSTSQMDNWILASSKSGDWIDVQPFESGDIIVLNGVVPDASSFTLHFLTASSQADYVLYTMNSANDIQVNGTWLLKTPALPTSDPQELTLNISNLPSNPGTFNDKVTVTASGGATNTHSNYSGNSIDMDVTVNNSPTDIFVTVYENGYPKYVSYKDITLPATIDLDASTEPVAADRKFTMTLPPNYLSTVAIDAFQQDEAFSHSMCRYFNSSGGTSINVGYKQGYQNYRTLISYWNGKKSFDLIAFGSTVEETHTFPSFDFTITNTKANDFQAVSVLPYDVAGINFQHNQAGLVLLWYAFQPPSGTSGAINFKAKDFPQEILDKHSALPSVEQIHFSSVYGHKFSSGNYADIIDAASKSGSMLYNPSSDNYIRFTKHRD